jgi:protein TonB
MRFDRAKLGNRQTGVWDNSRLCTPFGVRFAVVVLVMLLHGSLGFAWMMRPESPAMPVDTMSVSISFQQSELMPPMLIKPLPVIEAKRLLPEKVIEEVAEAVPQSTPVTPLPVMATAPVLAVSTEPDYKAAYLKNMLPVYPMAARSMGYRGSVRLNVEVLADGNVGQVLLDASSGYAVLDNAASQAVRGWHFTPARQAGHAITKWFIVPINFALKDNEA